MKNPEESREPKEKAAQHISEAHTLLKELRKELNEHPGLEEAILKLETALNILTAKTAGLL